MKNKKWYQSKTLIANTLMGVAIIAQAITGKEVLDANVQAAIIVVINFVLRLITKKGLE